MKNILVTGGAGFIGSNFIRMMLDKNEGYRIVNYDLLTYAGSLDNLSDIKDNPSYTFVHGDIRNSELVERVFDEFKIDTVVNFAAESHVDRSIAEPQVFLTTNIIGTQVLLNAAKQFWNINPTDKNSLAYKDGVQFLQISTDEVYGALGDTGRFTEDSPLNPSSPYSASKLSADLIALSYYKTFNLPITITRCSNNYGPHQHPEKLIPLMITNCINERSLPVYGDGKQVRDWIYVLDHCEAIYAVLVGGKSGEVYNIGGDNERENIEIVKQIISILNKDESLISYVTDRLGHDRRYAVDSSKMKDQLGWCPKVEFEDGLKNTVSWYRERNSD